MPRKRRLRYVTDSGGNGDVIVLLHGFLASSRYWNRLKPRLLAAGYRVVTIDLLGFGKAPKPKHALYNYSEHVGHIHKAIDSLELTQPFIIAGHSMGALLAMRFSRDYTKKVASLILLQPPLFRNANEAYLVLRSTGAHYRFLFDSRLRTLGWSIIRLAPFRIIANHTRPSREGSLSSVIEAGEGLEDLKNVGIQTLVLLGLRDRPQYINNVSNLTLNTHIDLVYTDAAHHMPIRSPKRTARSIIEFLNKR